MLNVFMAIIVIIVFMVFIGDNDLNGVYSAYDVDVNTYSMLIFEL